MSNNKVDCGFNKWSIEYNDNGSVVVEFDHYPNAGRIMLWDASPNDLRNLGEMFLSAARRLELDQ